MRVKLLECGPDALADYEITLHDHVIVGKGATFSFRRRGS
jgi:DNA repair protein RadC